MKVCLDFSNTFPLHTVCVCVWKCNYHASSEPLCTKSAAVLDRKEYTTFNTIHFAIVEKIVSYFSLFCIESGSPFNWNKGGRQLKAIPQCKINNDGETKLWSSVSICQWLSSYNGKLIVWINSITGTGVPSVAHIYMHTKYEIKTTSKSWETQAWYTRI